MTRARLGLGLLCLVLLGAGLACGRQPSRLLRQGQLPIYDFPLYLSEGTAGRVWRIDRDRSRTIVAEGLTDPRGIAVDRFGDVYVAEYGAGRLLRLKGDGSYDVVLDGLDGPSVVAVDGFGEVYVGEDGPRSIMRASDAKVFGTYGSAPTALTFGVDDLPVIGLYGEDRVLWGWSESDAKAAEAPLPVNASVDGAGRVYVAQGDALDGRVVRYHQREPGSEPTLVAAGILGPGGIAVDLIGNVFLVEQGVGRIVLVTYDGRLHAWITDLEDPQSLAFTQY